jgi:hypothetical protein
MKQVLKSDFIQDKYNELLEQITGYWEKEVWDVRENPLLKDNWKHHNYRLYLNRIKSVRIRNEIKYFLMTKLLKREYQLSTVHLHLSPIIHEFGGFIDLHFAKYNSFADLQVQNLMMHWRSHLIQNDKKTDKELRVPLGYRSSRESKIIPSTYVSFVKSLFEFYEDYYDERDEFSKDKWDVRKLGIEYEQTRSHYHINFLPIPEPFRELVKKYVKLKIFQGSLSFQTAAYFPPKLALFFKSILERHPDVTVKYF